MMRWVLPSWESVPFLAFSSLERKETLVFWSREGRRSELEEFLGRKTRGKKKKEKEEKRGKSEKRGGVGKV